MDEEAVDQATKEATDNAGVAEAGLPRRGELVSAVLVDELAKLLCELGIGIEVADEDSIVA